MTTPVPPPILPSRPAMTTAETVRRVFVGKSGIRAGWSVVIFFAIAVVLFMPLAGLLIVFVKPPLSPKGPMPVWPMLLSEAALAIDMIGTTLIMAKIERRPATAYWLRAPDRVRKFGTGLIAGLISMTLLVSILVGLRLLVFDGVSLSGAAVASYGLLWALVFLLTGFFEETFTRGYLHFTLTRGINFWWSSVITSIFFFVMHLGNGGENPIGLLAVFAAGAFFCLSLRLTGSLYWAIGFHAAWDWAQSYLFGVADSGSISQGRLLATHPVGNPILSGGSAGPEGSALSLGVLAIASIALWLAYRKTAPTTMNAIGLAPSAA